MENRPVSVDVVVMQVAANNHAQIMPDTLPCMGKLRRTLPSAIAPFLPFRTRSGCVCVRAVSVPFTLLYI